MDSIYFKDPLGLLIELAAYRFEPPAEAHACRRAARGTPAAGGGRRLQHRARAPRRRERATRHRLGRPPFSRGSAAGLGAIATDPRLLERTVEAAARRPELERVPPALTASEIRE